MTYCAHPHAIERTAKVGSKTFTVMHCPACGDTWGKKDDQ